MYKTDAVGAFVLIWKLWTAS